MNNIKYVLRDHNDGYITVEKLVFTDNGVYKFSYKSSRRIGEVILVLKEISRLRKQLLEKEKNPNINHLYNVATKKVAQNLGVYPSTIRSAFERDLKCLTDDVVGLIENYLTGKVPSLQEKDLWNELIKSVEGTRKEKIDRLVIERLMECMDLIA